MHTHYTGTHNIAHKCGTQTGNALGSHALSQRAERPITSSPCLRNPASSSKLSSIVSTAVAQRLFATRRGASSASSAAGYSSATSAWRLPSSSATSWRLATPRGSSWPDSHHGIPLGVALHQHSIISIVSNSLRGVSQHQHHRPRRPRRLHSTSVPGGVSQHHHRPRRSPQRLATTVHPRSTAASSCLISIISTISITGAVSSAAWPGLKTSASAGGGVAHVAGCPYHHHPHHHHGVRRCQSRPSARSPPRSRAPRGFRHI